MSDTMGRPLDNPFEAQASCVVIRGVGRYMKVYGLFASNIEALHWAHAKWDDGGYMIKVIRAPMGES